MLLRSFGESKSETLAGVGYKGAKSGSGSKLAEAIVNGCDRIVLCKGVAISTSGSTPYSPMGAESEFENVCKGRREVWLT